MKNPMFLTRRHSGCDFKWHVLHSCYQLLSFSPTIHWSYLYIIYNFWAPITWFFKSQDQKKNHQNETSTPGVLLMLYILFQEHFKITSDFHNYWLHYIFKGDCAISWPNSPWRFLW
jgi:hypothetical protein